MRFSPALRHALRPDLEDCALEERCLLVYPPGLIPSPFLLVNSASNAMIVPGTSGPSSGGTGGSAQTPGPSFYNLTVGQSFGGSGGIVPQSGGTISVFNVNNTHNPSFGGAAGGGGGGGSSSTSSSSGVTSANGYGSSFSSGYSFGLSSTNNFGVLATTTLGSVPVRSYSGGGGYVETPPATQDDSGMAATSQGLPSDGIQGLGINSLIQDPGVLLKNSLLGKSPGLITPSTAGMGQAKP